MTLLSIQERVTSTGKPLICELCNSGDPAVSCCTNCKVFMCEYCVTAHKRINTFHGHQFLTLLEVKNFGSKALAKPAFCTKHADEVLKLYCDTCQKTICRDCTIVDHRDHKYNFVADVAESLYRDSVLTFKCQNDVAPQYLTSKFTKRSNIHTRNTRTRNSLQIPLYKTAIGQRTFSYRGAYIWNNLHNELRQSASLASFKRALKDTLLRQTFPS